MTEAKTKLAQEMYNYLEPWATEDPDHGNALLKYVNAICAMLEEVDDIVRDDLEGGIPGWSKLLDPDRCPAGALPYLAQYTGTRLTPGATEEQQRQEIKTVSHWLRGTRGHLMGAARKYLSTPDAPVVFRERDGNPFRFTVITYTGTTPDPVLVLAELKKAKPAGYQMNYETLTGQDWQHLLDTRTTWAEVLSVYTTWGDVANDQAA